MENELGGRALHPTKRLMIILSLPPEAIELARRAELLSFLASDAINRDFEDVATMYAMSADRLVSEAIALALRSNE